MKEIKSLSIEIKEEKKASGNQTHIQIYDS